MALPTLALPGFGFGNGPGGDGPLQLTDPTLDLRRNLNQGPTPSSSNTRPTSPAGSTCGWRHCPQFDASGWRNVQMRLESGRQLPQIPGMSTSRTSGGTPTIKVLDFGSEYLPLPYAPRDVTVAGNWALRPELAGHAVDGAGRPGDAIRNLTYSVRERGHRPRASRTCPGASPAPRPTRRTPPSCRRICPTDLDEADPSGDGKGADTDAAESWAIQEFLRGTDFTYSTEPLPGSGYRALENFLLRDRRGYCEQFAASMAMMAREVGIPSRVAVGFLPGERVEDNTWEVSIRDMHAWPELFFAGYGWVRFEPTPASVTGTAPLVDDSHRRRAGQ